jgi:hypothetical protein
MPDPVPAEQVTPPAVPASPTGVAVIPAKVVPYLLTVLAVLGSLIALGVGDAPVLPILRPAEPYMQALAAVLTALLGLTPGLRRAAVVLLCVGSLSMTGCLHLKPGGEAKLIACGTSALQSEVVGVMPDVVEAISGGPVDWQPQLDAVIARVGGAALCALAVLIANLEVGGGAGAGVAQPATAPQYPNSVLLMRAYSYQAAHPFAVQ